MGTIFYLCFTNSLNITFFILLLVLLEPILKKYISAVCLYSLWVVLLIGLLVPVRFDTSKALFYISSPRISDQNNASDGLRMQDSNESYNSSIKGTLSQKRSTLDTRYTNNSSKGKWTYYIGYLLPKDITYIVQKGHLFFPQLWILGAILWMAVKATQYSKYRKLLKRFIVPINQEDLREVYNQCIQELNFYGRKEWAQYSKIIIYKCSIITSPMTMGIFKPTILLPEGSYSNNDFYFILKHELIHIRRRDSLMKLLRLIVLVLNWYNPLCYVLSRHLDHWCETSCDELVINNSTRSECFEYSKLLLKYTAVKKITTNTFNMFGGKDSMKYRLHSIMDQRKKYSSKVLAILLLCIVFSTVIVSTFTHTDVSASTDNTATKESLVKSEEMGDVIANNAPASTINDSNPVDNGATDKDMEVINSKTEADLSVASLREKVVLYALQAQSAQYLWGGNDLSVGVDSSGFVQAIYKEMGYELPRTSREQAKENDEISLDELKPGDLIFYGRESEQLINHVAIYIGEKKVIHATNMRDK